MPESDPIFADQSLAIEVLRRQIQQRTASGARRMVSLRPDEAESLLSLIDDFFLGTCDWGDCDRLAVDTSMTECLSALRKQNMEYRLYLEQRMNRLLAESHAIGQSSKCDGCTEATQIWQLLRDVVPVKGTSVPGHE